jgi:hypothetical protein
MCARTERRASLRSWPDARARYLYKKEDIMVGDRVFHYPFCESDENSFQQRPSTEFTMYSVISLPTYSDIVLIGAFDETEEPQQFTRKSMLAGNWWFNRLF